MDKKSHERYLISSPSILAGVNIILVISFLSRGLYQFGTIFSIFLLPDIPLQVEIDDVLIMRKTASCCLSTNRNPPYPCQSHLNYLSPPCTIRHYTTLHKTFFHHTSLSNSNHLTFTPVTDCMQGNDDVSFAILFAFMVWDYIPTTLLIVTITSKQLGTELLCVVFKRTMLCYVVLRCIVLCCIVMQCIFVCFIDLYCVIFSCIFCVRMDSIELYCGGLCCITVHSIVFLSNWHLRIQDRHSTLQFK